MRNTVYAQQLMRNLCLSEKVNIPLGAALYKWWGYLHIKVNVAMELREETEKLLPHAVSSTLGF